MESKEIIYIDYRPITIPKLQYYPSGLCLPSGDNTLKVSLSEFRSLMKKKNGTQNCFVEKKAPSKIEKIKEEVTEDECR